MFDLLFQRVYMSVAVLTLYYGAGIKRGKDGAISSLWYYANEK